MSDLQPAALAPAPRRVPVSTKLAYGVGSVAYGIKDNGFSTLLLLFYNQVIGLPAQMVGLAVMIALIFDAFADPLIGHLSDNTRSRWGRRHPFMYAAALPVGALYLLLWNPPTGDQTVTLIYLVVVAILVRTAISCYEVPSSALAPELTTDYHERTSILGYRYMFGWAGGMGMLLLTFGVFLAPSREFPAGQLNPGGYRTYAMVAASMMVGAILLSTLGTHRQIARLPKAPSTRGRLSDVLRALRNRNFLVLMLAGVFAYTSQGLSFALTTYFYTYLWQFPASVLVIYTLAVMVGVALGFAAATHVSRRLGKRNAAILFLLLAIPTTSAPYILHLLGLAPSRDGGVLLPLLLASTLIATAMGVGVAILAESMMSDIVEEAQATSGERNEGVFFAGSFFMKKSVSGVGIFLSGALLAFARFPDAATPGAVEAAVLDRLTLSYVALTITCGLAAALILRAFGITQAGHEARVTRLLPEEPSS
ncbi:MFS transporter [Caulobacter sp. DWR1-3-2b1]|uniref:MFS transporter n=1 Tax=Caulobacter sp. DWR1-3-2b1 TaxID=2804670 RepID=UPI003CEBD892